MNDLCVLDVYMYAYMYVYIYIHNIYTYIYIYTTPDARGWTHRPVHCDETSGVLFGANGPETGVMYLLLSFSWKYTA